MFGVFWWFVMICCFDWFNWEVGIKVSGDVQTFVLRQEGRFRACSGSQELVKS